jgi:hypothetical protein
LTTERHLPPLFRLDLFSIWMISYFSISFLHLFSHLCTVTRASLKTPPPPRPVDLDRPPNTVRPAGSSFTFLISSLPSFILHFYHLCIEGSLYPFLGYQNLSPVIFYPHFLSKRILMTTCCYLLLRVPVSLDVLVYNIYWSLKLII